MTLVEVAVLVPVAGTYTYALPEGWAIAPGARVWVPFGPRGVEGVVVAVRETSAMEKQPPGLKRVERLVEAPPLDGELLELASWVASYYLSPPGEALRLCLPPAGRARETRRVRFTVAGEAVAAGFGQALDSAAIAGLGLRERAALEALHREGGECPVKSVGAGVDGAHAALKALVERGLVEWVSLVQARRERRDLLVSAVPSETAESLLARAPRRLELYRRLLDGGETPLAALRAFDPRAADQVRALVEVGLARTREVVAPRDAFAAPVEIAAPAHLLNPDQAVVVDRLVAALDEKRYAPFLLHGITGSGKTEVYLRVIAAALERGRGALALVPEISLTPQLAARFRARFGDQVAVLHSGLGDRERFAAWSRLQDGRLRIALGARSAVYAPIANLGVVVVDEEHDPSFKQEEGVRYHGRDAALVRARHAGAVAILGSATPSLEIYEATRAGRMERLELPRRATPRSLPSVEVVDLRVHKPGADGLLSAPLVQALATTLAAGEQSIIFLNRRGFATFILCRACGHRFTCKDCSVALTFHRGGGAGAPGAPPGLRSLNVDRLACHYCGYLEPAPTRCPECKAASVERLGLGTEKVAAVIAERFPSARVARLDRDTAHGAGLERVLGGVRRGEVDVTVGTQMITKGHDFPGVTLVGVLLADQSMNFPDFRASERTFQLLEQVAGRAGRGERPGRVIIQTFVPGHSAVLRAQDHDYARFFEDERREREERFYPPFARLGMVRIDGVVEAEVRLGAEAAGVAARAAATALAAAERIAVLGPTEAPLARIKGRARWQLLVKAPDLPSLRAVLAAVQGAPIPSGVRLVVDVDPVSVL